MSQTRWSGLGMLSDKLLIWKFNRGDKGALRPIYEKYKDDLVTLAAGLLTDVSAAEDAVHDVFASFLASSTRFRLTGSLKGYLATCVANNARNRNKALRRQRRVGSVLSETVPPDPNRPDFSAMFDEQQSRLSRALEQLPYEQREVLFLHIHGQVKFRTIAETQGVSVNTVQGRYRYGLQKLRSMLDGEANE